MKIIYNKYLPVKGFRAINLFGVVFVRKESEQLYSKGGVGGTKHLLDERVVNHESIHTRQMLELAIVGFYVWYVLEWLLKWIVYRDRFLAYKNICFEREAFDNDQSFNYLKHRKIFAFMRYV